MYFTMRNTGNFKLTIRLTYLSFYPTYFRVIMNFYCNIDFILHHNLRTTLRYNVSPILVNVLKINYIVMIIHMGTSRYIILLCFINYSCTMNNCGQFEKKLTNKYHAEDDSRFSLSHIQVYNV